VTSHLDIALGNSAATTLADAGPQDWAGAWFEILEEMGEFVGMRAGHRAPGATEPAWQFCSHTGYDGLGWFVTLIRQQQADASIAIPRMTETKRPSWFSQTGALLRLMARKPQQAATWAGWNGDWQAPPGGAAAGSATATHVFDVSGTRRLADVAAAKGVSVNSLLLAALGRAGAAQLQSGPALWMIPVNMRGPVNLARETANHTSYLQIATGAEATAQDVHHQIKTKLGNNEHWGAWLFTNCGRLVRLAGMKYLFNRELSRTGGRPWTGAFSNLGTWDNCGRWSVCPPVAKTCPVGVGVVTCDGCLSLTIDAHPSITSDASWSRTLMDRWVVELMR
jgi:hypothetical protein